MKLPKQLLLIIATLLVVISCKTVEENPAKPKTLRSVFEDAFYVGTAINDFQIEETDSLTASIVGNEFNSITAENIMKSEEIHPTKDSFNYELADKFVALGEKHNMFIHGHTLIWHSQLSPWIRQIKDSAEMVSALESHTKAIVSRYKGRIDSWDVVNEA